MLFSQQAHIMTQRSQKQDRRTQLLFLLSTGLFFLLLILAGKVTIVQASSDSIATAGNIGLEEQARPTGHPTTRTVLAAATPTSASTAAVAKGSSPTMGDTYLEIPTGFTEDGYPYLGTLDAPITLIEFSDYLCPFCKRHFDTTLPGLLDAYVRTGQVRLIFHDFPLTTLHPTAPIGHQAALCVAEQGAPLFWAMHDQLYLRQAQWNQRPDPRSFLATLSSDIGVDMARYTDCMESGRTTALVDERIALGQAFGFNGTPSFQFVMNESSTGTSGQSSATDQTEAQTPSSLVGAYPITEFQRWIDSLLATGAAPEEAEVPTPEPQELPFWANAGLAPDPKRPGYTLAGDQYKGNPDAALVIVEFADFQCPACRDHLLTTQPVLDERFIESNEILWVHKNLPLREHPQAAVAAVAAECAAEQGKFWEMHDLLYAEQDAWSTEEPDDALIKLATGLELDRTLFAACFNSRQAMEQILADLYDAQGIVQTTPSFILLYEGRGAVLRGTQTANQFVELIQNRLDKAPLKDD